MNRAAACHGRSVARSWGPSIRLVSPQACSPCLASQDISEEGNPHSGGGLGYNYYLAMPSVSPSLACMTPGSHSGFCSSHFFLRIRQVRHPVLVRLLKLRFRLLGSC